MRLAAKIIIAGILLLAFFGAIGFLVSPPTNNSSTVATQGASSAAEQIATSGPPQAYSDPTYNFSVEIPGQWEIFRYPFASAGDNATNILPVLSTHPSQGAGFAVFVDKAPGTDSSSQYAAIYKAKLAQIFVSDGGVTVTSTVNATLGGAPAYAVNYVVHFPADVGGNCGPVTDIVSIHDGLGYIVSFDDCNAAQEAANMPLFMAFASSFAYLP